MTAHNGRGQDGDLPYEGVVLPANAESYPPERHGRAEHGEAPQPTVGQPWGQPWGPETSSPPAAPAAGPSAAPLPPATPAPPPAPPSTPPAMPVPPPQASPGALPGERQDHLPRPYDTRGAGPGSAPLPPVAPGREQWAPPPPPGMPPSTPPPAHPPFGSAAPEGPAAPPVPYEPPAGPPPGGPYGPGQGQEPTPVYDDGDVTRMLPPQQAVSQAPPQSAPSQPSPPHAAPGPLPPAVDADATQMLPPQPGGPVSRAGDPWPSAERGTAEAEATQMLPPQEAGADAGWPPQQPGAGDADATQMLPAQGLRDIRPEAPHAGDAGARRPDAGPPPAGAPYGIRPGAPGDRQPPSEFDSLFRSSAPPAAGDAGRADGTHGAGFRGPDRGGPDTAPGAAPYGRAARRDADRRSGGRGGRGGMSPAVLAGVGVVAVLVVGLGVGALTGGGDEEPKGGGSPTEPVAGGLPSEPVEPADPAEAQAKQLSQLLEKSNNSRNSVIRAVQDIKACQKLDQAASDLRSAAQQRNGLVTRLSQIQTDALPNGTELDAALTTAWKASAEADNAYAAWADQVAGKKGCKKGEARATQQTAAGNRASGEATTAKKKAAELWNPTAREYGLPERQYTQL